MATATPTKKARVRPAQRTDLDEHVLRLGMRVWVCPDGETELYSGKVVGGSDMGVFVKFEGEYGKIHDVPTGFLIKNCLLQATGFRQEGGAA